MTAPNEVTLRRFLLGQLSAAEAGSVEVFIETDPEASHVLDRLAASDPFVSGLRGRSGEPAVPAEAEALARRLECLPSESTRTAGGDSSADFSGIRTEQDVTAFLAPAQGPGEIGRLGDFRILRVLGRGGMGVVFEAEDTRLGRHVAIKAMLPKIASDPLAKQRFVREAKAAAAVEHDHVVPIHLIDEANGVPFLVMPYLKGESLDDRLKRDGMLPIAEVVRIGRETAEGLAAAHAQNLVHRDIKPGNLWLEAPKGRVKILDFGLARPMDKGPGAEITQSGAVVGTPAYMSPEQGRGQPVNFRTDLFSLGSVLYRACTGQTPFQGSDTASVLMALAADTPVDPRRLNPRVPGPLAALIMQLLEKDPAKRLPSARSVAERLSPAMENLPAGDDRPRPEFAFDADETEVVPVANTLARRKRTGMWIGVAAAVLALGVISLFAPTIIRVATNKGVLVVEVDEPNAVVVVKGEAVEIDVDDGGKRRVFAVRATDNGQVEVREPGSTVALVSRSFQVKRGGRFNVQVTRDNLADARKSKPVIGPSVAPVSTDRDRRAAEMLHPYAELDLRLADGNAVTVRLPDTMPAAPFKITKINIPATNKPYPKPLYTAILLPAIEGLTELTMMSTGGYPIPPTEDEFLRVIRSANWKELQSHVQLTPKVHAALKALPDLTGVAFDARAADDALLASLPADFPRLTSLGMHRLGESGKVTAGGLANLKRFSLSGLGLTDTTVVNRDLCRMLAELPSLENLSIWKSNVDDDGLRELAQAKRLWSLNLDFTAVTDVGLAHLEDLRMLRVLYVRWSKVSKAGVETLAAARPGCYIEYDGGTIKPNGTLPGAAQLVGEQRKAFEWVLSTGGLILLEADGKLLTLKKGNAIPDRPVILLGVSLAELSAVDNTALTVQLQRLPPLVGELDLRGTSVSTIEFNAIAKFPCLAQITVLRLDRSKINNLTLGSLRFFPQLTRFTLSGCKLNAPSPRQHGIKDFALAPSLREVEMDETTIVPGTTKYFRDLKLVTLSAQNCAWLIDEVVDDLAAMSTLTDLRAKGSGLTATGAKKLAAALPKCRIEIEGKVFEPKK